MMSLKERAQELWNQRVATAAKDPRAFRGGIIETLKAEFGCSTATASTQYNNVKKRSPPVEGLGRAPGVKRQPKAVNPVETEDADSACYSVIELTPHGKSYQVGRTRAFILQGDASEIYDTACQSYPNSVWVMIKGIGPFHGDSYRLASGEYEIKRSR